MSPELPVFDPADYGKPAATPFDASSRFDRSFELTISEKPGFFDGRPGMQWAINGRIFPDVPTFVVEEGDLVEIEISNETDAAPPDAPARPPRARAEPRRRGRSQAARGGPTR